MDYSKVPSDEVETGAEPQDAQVPPVCIPDGVAQKEKIKKKNMAGIFEVLFRFSDGLDKFLMIVGTVCAAINGQGFTVLIVLLGGMIEEMINLGRLENYMNLIGDYLQGVNQTELEILARPHLLDCKAVQNYYGTNDSACTDSSMQSSLLDAMREDAVYMLCAGVIIFFAQCGQAICWTVVAERRAHRTRRACLGNILRQDIGWFDTEEIAQINSKLTGDISNIQEGTGDKMGSLIQWCCSALSTLITGFVLGWKLTLVLLGPAPLLIISTSLYSRAAASVTSKEQAAYARAGGIAEEVLGSIKTVAAFGGEEKEAFRYKKNLSESQNCAIQKGLYSGFSIGLFMCFLFAFTGLGYWYGNKLCHEDGYTLSDVFAVTFVLITSGYSVGMTSSIIPVYLTARCSAHTVFNLTDRKSKIDSMSEDGKKPNVVKGTIRYEDVHFAYPSRPGVKVLNGFSLEVGQGQTVAVVGSSGCGKSTVVQLLLRFYDPQKGRILIDGQDIRDLNVKWLRTVVGVVSQEPVLFATTIAENIRYGREGVPMREIEEATKTANAYDFIMDLPKKFDTVVGERGCQLSGGQKQRLAIARALVRDPKILLLDEATSALDTESESIVQDALNKSCQGRTTVVVAHRLSTIKNADYVLGIDGGKVAEMGTHEELMEKQGIYYKLVMNQQSSTSGKVEESEQTEDSQIGIYMNGKEKIKPSGEGEEEKEENLPSAPLSRLLPLMAPDWLAVVIGCFASILNGLAWPSFGIMVPYMLKAFAYVDEDKQEREVTRYALIVGSLGIVVLLVNILQSYMFSRSGEALTKRLRDQCFRSMLKQPMSFYDDHKNNVGALTTKLATDASLVQGMTGIRLGSGLTGMVNIIVALILGFYHGWKIALVILAFIPLNVINGLTLLKLAAGQTGKSKKALEEATKISVESTGNIKTVASLTLESHFLESYMQKLKASHTDVLRKSLVVGILFGFGQGVQFLSYSTTFWYGAGVVENGDLKFDDVLLVVYAVIVGAMGLGYTMAFVPEVGKAQMATRRIFQILDLKSSADYTNSGGTRLNANFKPELTFKDVEFQYPNRKSVKVLDGMTFTVSPQQTVALVGSSGCGKSTAVNLIERFYDCDSGRVALDSNDVKCLNLKWLREQIGIVSQEPVLFDKTIAENIAYGDNSRTVSMNEIISAARDANIHSFISSLPEKYDTNVGLKGTQLSGGQKQRIAIARALVRNPSILLLDEATSALDTESEKIVQEALDDARKGRTCVVIAHRLSTIQNADKICVINNGIIEERGTHGELVAKMGIYYNLVKHSVKEE